MPHIHDWRLRQFIARFSERPATRLRLRHLLLGLRPAGHRDAGALQMLSFGAAFIARLCPEFGEVQRWPEEMAEEQSGDVDAVMDTWRETFRYLLTLGERAGRFVVDD